MTFPAGWQFATALDGASGTGGHVTFKAAPLETVADSPIVAGKYFSRLDLDPGSAVPVHLDLVADRPSQLEITPDQLAQHRALVQQAYKLFGSHHYDHYDFLVTISDTVARNGLEHHRSSEDDTYSDYLSDYDKAAQDRDLLPHEYTHSWNGKFRRPADLWTPRSPTCRCATACYGSMRGRPNIGAMCWRRGRACGPRIRRWTRSPISWRGSATLPGRSWRPLQDTTNDEIIDPRRPVSWRSWQRFEDYYVEGAFIWLDADTLIREMSHGAQIIGRFRPRLFRHQ